MLLWLISICLLAPGSNIPATHVDHPGLKKLGWQQAVSGDAFKGHGSIFGMIDTLHAMDVHHIELVAGLPLSGEKKDVLVSPAMAAEDVDAILAKLKSDHMDIVSYDASDMAASASSQGDLKGIFEFGKRLKVKNIVVAARADDLDRLDQFAAENSIKVALRANDDAASIAVDALPKALASRSNRLGACFSPAECAKHHVDPVEYARKLKDHIVEVELLDAASDGHPVPLGQGDAKIADMLGELHQQQFKGVFTIKPDTTGPQTLEHLAQSIDAFSKIVTSLAADDRGK